MIKLHWHATGNLGDALAPLLTRKITGDSTQWVAANILQPYLLTIGSQLFMANQHAHIVGTGTLYADKPAPAAATYYAVRGPKTRAAVLASGGTCPERYGDLGLLVADEFPRTIVGGKIGIALHQSEKQALREEVIATGHRFLDVQLPLSAYLDALVGCDLVLSSSLHGLVVAHSYGIPAAWIQPTTTIKGGTFKFQDYLQSVGLPTTPAGDSLDPADLLAASQLAALPQVNRKPEILEAFEEAYAAYSDND